MQTNPGSIEALEFLTPSSPCIGVCTLHDTGFCIGCFRTQEEILVWAALDEPRRREIMSSLPGRITAWFEKGCCD